METEEIDIDKEFQNLQNDLSKIVDYFPEGDVVLAEATPKINSILFDVQAESDNIKGLLDQKEKLIKDKKDLGDQITTIASSINRRFRTEPTVHKETEDEAIQGFLAKNAGRSLF